jgi:hypothetical protein
MAQGGMNAMANAAMNGANNIMGGAGGMFWYKSIIIFKLIIYLCMKNYEFFYKSH